MSDASPVDLVDVSFRYRGGRVALRSVSACLTAKGVTALVGPNGAGKSTLFSIGATLARPTSGVARVLGVALERGTDVLALRRQIGFLPQSFGYVASFTVTEFVSYAAWLKVVPREETAVAVERAIEAVGLGGERDTRLGRLSGGMRRRAGIAHALVHRPALLILDEPTAGLDPQQRVRLRALLRDISRGSKILVSTHLIEDVAAIADEVVILDEGTIVHHGSVESVLALGDETEEGDTDLERGYSAALRKLPPEAGERRAG